MPVKIMDGTSEKIPKTTPQGFREVIPLRNLDFLGIPLEIR